jgi:hypothetical protein
LPLPKAKIFMGDGGSQFLGFVLAVLPLLDNGDGNPTCLFPMRQHCSSFRSSIRSPPSGAEKEMDAESTAPTGSYAPQAYESGFMARGVDAVSICCKVLSVFLYIYQ